METIIKELNPTTKVIFDVDNSDHGNSGIQFYYGKLVTKDIDCDFTIAVMHDSNTGTESYDLTFIDIIPVNVTEKEILDVFDWEEINQQHEDNQMELNKTMDKCRDFNWD